MTKKVEYYSKAEAHLKGKRAKAAERFLENVKAFKLKGF